MREEKEDASDEEEEDGVAEVGDAVRWVRGGVVGGVVHGRLEDGFAVGEDDADGGDLLLAEGWGGDGIGGEGEESGRALHDAHVPEAGHGASKDLRLGCLMVRCLPGVAGHFAPLFIGAFAGTDFFVVFGVRPS